MAATSNPIEKQEKRWTLTKIKKALSKCNPFRRRAVLASALLLASCGGAPAKSEVQDVKCTTDCADVRIDAEGDLKKLFYDFLKGERCKNGCQLFDVPELTSISMDLPKSYSLVGDRNTAVLYIEQSGETSLEVRLACNKGQQVQAQCGARLNEDRALSLAVGEAVISEKVSKACQSMDTPIPTGLAEVRVNLNLFGIHEGKGNISSLLCVVPK